jgi:hypothetical protein
VIIKNRGEMKENPTAFTIDFPVINLKPGKTLYRLFSRSMHETLNRLFSKQATIYPAVAAYPGNGLLSHLKRRQTNPLLYPAVI